ncbi:transcriptional regulator, BadM/Rrf2 family [Solimonas aquatica]|uniref:Transcriptional regulator, BadM/Rrf2 family n=1 Tax=Solimonas aquatica TaxID=489703 RepID=A0A1H9D4D3_9GAMM|nr:SUF system Fe-S cluster assembly regulator [Solimonas aquatica]SEQ07703.1 transcriptional regulator, BadM/Rrf2 family [Solimonas aquatica]
MLKLSKLADYATLLMTAVAREPTQTLTGQQLSERTRIPVPTVAKLLKLLARGGLLESVRGAHGGYRLAREAARISVADIIGALEGPIAVTACSSHGGECSIETDCATRSNWRLINSAIRGALEAVSLAQMAARHSEPARNPGIREFPLIRL